MPRQNEHTHSSTQDKPIGHSTGLNDLKRAIQNWGPEILGFGGDIMDVAGNVVQRAQGKRGPNIRPGEFGNSARRRFAKAERPPNAQTVIEEPSDLSAMSLLGTVANPFLFMSPTKLAGLTQQYPHMASMVAAAHGMDMPSGALGVIKERHGNWLEKAGLERALRQLRQGDPSTSLMKMEEYNKTVQPGEGMNPEKYPWIDTFSGEIFTPTQAQEILKDQALNNWVKGPLTKYIKRDMGTEQDPIRALAEQGILHLPEDQLNFNPLLMGDRTGQRLLAKSRPARMWEGTSDEAIMNDTAAWYQTNANSPTMQANPWITNLAPDTPVYTLSNPTDMVEDLGFTDLMGELRGAMWADKITPEQLNSGRFGVEAAVRLAHEQRVAKEAAEKARLTALSRNSATQTIKEYPDSPEGFHWVEFKAPEGTPQVADPGHPALRGPYPDVPEDELTKLRLMAKRMIDEDYGEIDDADNLNDAIDDLMPNLVADWREMNSPGGVKILRDALEYEGDQMGHCIGSYCSDVASGRSRLFSLRDSEGKPWVSIQGSPEGKRYLKDSIYQKSMGLENAYDKKHGEGAYQELLRGQGAPGMTPAEAVQFQSSFSDDHDVINWLQNNPKFSHLVDDSWLTPPEKALQQIKGSGKKLSTQDITPEDAPKLFPYIQDFVKEGGWNDLQDLQNTGLMDLNTAYTHNKMHSKPEFLNFLTEQFDQGINYMPKDELQAIYEKFHGSDAGPVYAEGGLVKEYHPEHFEDLNVFLGLDPH